MFLNLTVVSKDHDAKLQHSLHRFNINFIVLYSHNRLHGQTEVIVQRGKDWNVYIVKESVEMIDALLVSNNSPAAQVLFAGKNERPQS